MPVATLVDVDALWHTAVYSLAGTAALVIAFGVGVFAWDRLTGGESTAPSLSWRLLVGLSAVVCVAVVVVGLWAMTQK
jgi:hypothetical protein